MNSINNNLTALNVANTLNSHYGRLATSVERLSSGLRINSAADDAAGLAIRELMRADVAALNQGARNANDAISMLQVADGALGIIDEKLIRMKELAEQAATGTYNSTQRLMIHSEFQAMGDEIDRIARATDFNGINLLDGSLEGQHDGSGLNSTGAMKIHFGTANDSAEDYYYVKIGNCTTGGLGLRDSGKTQTMTETGLPAWLTRDATIDLESKKIFYDIPFRLAGLQDDSPAGIPGMTGMDYYELPVGLENINIVSDVTTTPYAHKPHVNLFTKSGQQLTGIDPNGRYTWITAGLSWPNYPPQKADGTVWWNDMDADTIVQNMVHAGLFNADATFNASGIVNNAGQSVTAAGATVTMITDMDYMPAAEEIHIDKVTDDLVFVIGGHAGVQSRNCNHYKLSISADLGDDFFNTYVQTENLGDEGDLIDIKTQEKAQKALERIDNAIVQKDKLRAHLGSLQNRLENTVTNLTIQRENLQTAESRISDVDVATEMTQFVRNQVLTQSAVAMLGQANSYPHMLARLING